MDGACPVFRDAESKVRATESKVRATESKVYATDCTFRDAEYGAQSNVQRAISSEQWEDYSREPLIKGERAVQGANARRSDAEFLDPRIPCGRLSLSAREALPKC
jgi:hypothetical protein